MRRRFALQWLVVLLLMGVSTPQSLRAVGFRKDVQPVLENYCYDCHADGADKGGVAFDTFGTNASPAQNRELWLKAFKNLRSGLMPPAKKDQPTDAEKQAIFSWIKADVFNIDPDNLDPGRVTVRRLNRAEYRNTIRDLLGVDYDTQAEFPADDTGNGFDNNGDVLTLSPILLEKYLSAAQSIVAQAVPVTSRVVAEKSISGADIGGDRTNRRGVLSLSYYEPASISNTFHIEHAGRYQAVLNLTGTERYLENQFDYNECRFLFSIDGKELFRREFFRETGKPLHFEFDQQWTAGDHRMTFELIPLSDREKVRSLAIHVNSVTLRGPFEEKYYVLPANYRRFFPAHVPAEASARRTYARDFLKNFATKAFRRPVDDEVVKRLAKLAEGIYSQPNQTFEGGLAQAMVAVLASPRFLFREEFLEPGDAKNASANVDEYSLASRLSYFLWSSMPDNELIRQAGAGTLRKNLAAQVKRMLADPRAEALTKNFGGQWLQTRDILIVPIKAGAVLARDGVDESEKIDPVSVGLRRPRRSLLELELDGGLRNDLRAEADSYFNYILRKDRDVMEFIDSDYTFLNARLARLYGLTSLNITGENLRKVVLPKGSPRGGVLTMGSVLAVTSNPTRTSPVKRGLFILDNILGTPSPPPPPNIPPLEDSESAVTNRHPSLRQVLAVHREQPMCASCHDRLDPPGLAFENFNALGIWRDKDRGQPVESSGELITGETFTNVVELKHILATRHRTDFYRCLTEKMLTYALGRGLEYYDVETVDRIVDQLKKDDGRFSALITGVIESVPFQKSRTSTTLSESKPVKKPERLADRN